MSHQARYSAGREALYIVIKLSSKTLRTPRLRLSVQQKSGSCDDLVPGIRRATLWHIPRRWGPNEHVRKCEHGNGHCLGRRSFSSRHCTYSHLCLDEYLSQTSSPVLPVSHNPFTQPLLLLLGAEVGDLFGRKTTRTTGSPWRSHLVNSKHLVHWHSSSTFNAVLVILSVCCPHCLIIIRILSVHPSHRPYTSKSA